MAIKRKTPPYAGTEVPPEKSKMQIERLLREYGADGVQWSEIWSQNRAQLTFVISGEKSRPIMVRLEPPPFSTQRRTWNAEKGRYEQIAAPNWAQSYRLLYAYLKAKLEAIAYGLRDVQEEFLSDMVVRDRQGRELKAGEIVEQQLVAGEFRPALGPGEAEAPPVPSARPNVHDTEGRAA